MFNSSRTVRKVMEGSYEARKFKTARLHDTAQTLSFITQTIAYGYGCINFKLVTSDEGYLELEEMPPFDKRIIKYRFNGFLPAIYRKDYLYSPKYHGSGNGSLLSQTKGSIMNSIYTNRYYVTTAGMDIESYRMKTFKEISKD